MAKRIVIYVTLLGDSTTAEWYAVSDTEGSGSDLWSDGFSDVSRTCSDVASSLNEWIDAQTVAPSPSSSHTPT